MPARTASAGPRLARTLGGMSVLAVLFGMVAAVSAGSARAATGSSPSTPATPSAVASAPTARAAARLTVALPSEARTGAWTVLGVTYDNPAGGRRAMALYTGFRGTGLVRAGRLRFQHRHSDGGWRDVRLTPGDEEYYAIERSDALPPGLNTDQFRVLVASGPGTLHVRGLLASGAVGSLAGFRHPLASYSRVVTVARPTWGTAMARSGTPTSAPHAGPTSAASSARPAGSWPAAPSPSGVASSATPAGGSVGPSGPAASGAAPGGGLPASEVAAQASRSGQGSGAMVAVVGSAGALLAAGGAAFLLARRARR